MKVTIIDPTSDSRWDDFVQSQATSTIFHTSAWARAIKEAYDFIPYYFILEDDNSRIKAAIPFLFVKSWLTGNRMVCLPYSDYCYPLGGDAAEISVLLDAAKKEVEKGTASYLEIRGWQNGNTPASHGLETRNYHLLYILDLQPGLNALKAKLHHSVKRGIHQAEQRGVTVRMTRKEEDLEKFYKLNVATRKKLGVFSQPYSFFRALLRHVISQDLGFLMLAEWEGKVIAGVLFLTYKDTIYYKFNASDEAHLQKRPNHLAIWEAIRYSCENGFKHCDFGRCSPEEEGLRVFKSRWGSEEINSPYYYYPAVKGFTSVSESSRRYKAMNILSHTMPEPIFCLMGSLIYKHLT